MWNFKRKNKSENELVTNNNELSFQLHYKVSDGYGSCEKSKSESIDKIINLFRTANKFQKTQGLTIESKMNDLYYPMFDLDSKSKCELFKTLYVDTTYIIFSSSYNNNTLDDNLDCHYWGFIDNSHVKLDTIFSDMNWKICNDEKYVDFSIRNRKLVMRGLYENKYKKPHIYEKNCVFSENFELFINKLEYYYNNEGFEMSILRYHDPELLIKYNRKLKLKNIIKNDV